MKKKLGTDEDTLNPKENELNFIDANKLGEEEEVSATQVAPVQN